MTLLLSEVVHAQSNFFVSTGSYPPCTKSVVGGELVQLTYLAVEVPQLAVELTYLDV